MAEAETRRGRNLDPRDAANEPEVVPRRYVGTTEASFNFNRRIGILIYLRVMRIGIDGGSLAIKNERQKLGVYQATLNLLLHLAKVDPKNEYWLFSFAEIEKKTFRELGPRIKPVMARPSFGWRYFGLPLGLLKKKPDVFLGLSQALPTVSFCPTIVVVYDLAFEFFPESYPEFGKRLKKITRHALKKANRVVAVSQATKKDLIKIHQIPEEKIKVIYLGCDSVFRPQPKPRVKKIREKYGLKDGYFLFVGSFKPIKNVPRIIEAFSKFLKKSEKPYQLVLVGSDIWLDKRIGKLGERVKNLGYLPKKDLPAIYSGAAAFISPSLYEGFGLPLLEAMACGVPVVTSNAGSMPEIVGEAGILVDPLNVGSIADGLQRALKRRKDLIELGLKRAKKFSWQKSAREFLDLIKEIG